MIDTPHGLSRMGSSGEFPMSICHITPWFRSKSRTEPKGNEVLIIIVSVGELLNIYATTEYISTL